MKLKKSIIIALLTLTALLTSCEQVFLGKDESNDPVNNFEILWNDFDQHYSLFEVRNTNWNSIYNIYRPLVNNKTTNAELWEIFKDMISHLDDSHTVIFQPKSKKEFNKDVHSFASGSSEDKLVKKEFSLSLLKETYLDQVSELKNSEPDLILLSAKIKNKNIGYIHMNAMEADDINFIDKFVKNLKDYEAIILDLRNNEGGSDVLAAEIAGRFATSEQLIYTVEERNGPNHSDFSDKKKYYSQKKGNTFYDKPLIVLTDKITVSAAEILLLHLKSFSQVTQIGDSTAGDFSDTSMRRFLPNGWQYQYSIFKFLLPNGKSLDGIGHIPDVQIRNTETNIKNKEDKVIEGAIQYLFDKYGIK